MAAFAVSGYASTEGRNCKPFNPLLGETYEADYPDKGLRFFSEKVNFILHVSCLCIIPHYTFLFVLTMVVRVGPFIQVGSSFIKF